MGRELYCHLSIYILTSQLTSPPHTPRHNSTHEQPKHNERTYNGITPTRSLKRSQPSHEHGNALKTDLLPLLLAHRKPALPTAKQHRLSATGKRFRLMTRVQPRKPPTSATLRIGHGPPTKPVDRNPANVTLNIVLSPRASADTGILTSALAYQTVLLNSPEICVPYQIARNETVSSSNIPPKTHLRPTRGRTQRQQQLPQLA